MNKTVLSKKFDDVSMFRTCEQCGCCSSACPITGKQDFNIRRIIRHVELDLIEEIGQTSFPWRSSCRRAPRLALPPVRPALMSPDI